MTMKKMLLLGLDGATFNILEPFAALGHLPFVKKLMHEGMHAPLRSTIPFISPTAWCSFITGKNPGKHGVFDFRSKVPGSYDFERNIPNVPKQGTIWKYLTESGKESLVFNVPMTFPPQKIKGRMVTGFGTPGLASDFTYPATLKKEILEKFNYELDVYWASDEYKGQEVELLDQLTKMTETKFKVINQLMQANNPDFVAFALESTDRIQHRFYRHIADYIANKDSTDPVVRKIISHMSMLDANIQKFYEEWNFTDVMIMSDHGFGLCDMDINMNSMFEKNGWLKFNQQVWKKDSPLKSFLRKVGISGHNLRSLIRNIGLNKVGSVDKVLHSKEKIKWDATKVFSVTESGIYLNVKDREPSGVIDQNNYEQVRDEVINALLEFRYKDKQIFKKIYKREELYWGDYLAMAPDIIIGDYDLQFVLNSCVIAPDLPQVDKIKTVLCGNHSIEGVFIAHGRNFSQSKFLSQPQIIDLAPTILAYYDVPIPQDIDGRVLEEIFSEKPSITKTDANFLDSEDADTLTEEERNKMLENLKGLGYI